MNIFTINHFRSVDSRSFETEYHFNFKQLVEYLRAYKVSSNKYANGAFLCGNMKEKHRNNDNVINRHTIVIDYDDLPQDTRLIETLKEDCEYSFILYSTFNHTTEAPRLRLVIPLSEPLPAQYYKEAVKAIENNIGIKCDTSSCTVSQAQARRVLKNDKTPTIFEYRDSKLLDTQHLIKSIEMYREKHKQHSRNNFNTTHRDNSHWGKICYGVGKGQRNESLASIAGLLLRKNLPFEVIIGLLGCWNICNSPPMTDKEVLKTINSIAKKHQQGGGHFL